MAIGDDAELIDRFEEFYRDYYRDEIGQLAQRYPNEQRSLYIDWSDLYRYDPAIAEDFVAKPGQMREYAEEALRLYDLPVDVKLGGAHVRMENLGTSTGIREIRSDHVGNMVASQGIVRKATDVRPKMQEAAFECQRCGTLTRIPQSGSGFQEPHQCGGCERQGPFKINFDQSEFVDAQKLRIQESPEGLRGGETPQAIDVNIEDDITGRVTAGDHVTAIGILHLEQQGSNQEKTSIFDFYMEGLSITIEDEQFEEMDISEQEEEAIVELSRDPEIYEKMVDSMAPSIFGYEMPKLAIIMQLFSGVRKALPDGSRIRGDIHILAIGDPGTGKCVSGDTSVTLGDGSKRPIRDLVESNLEDPTPIDDGVWDEVDIEVPSMADDGSLGTARATKVWKREAPDQMYRVQTESGRAVEVTPSHPLFTVRNGRTEAVVAEDLTEGESIAVPRTPQTDGDGSLDASVRRSQSKNPVRMDVPGVGEVLRETRETLGLTEAECGLPRSTYQHYERGDRDPSRDRLRTVLDTLESAASSEVVTDGGVGVESTLGSLRALVHDDIAWDPIESIETVDPADEWVYDLEVEGTHNYLSNDIVSHNSQILQYVKKLAPRSVYTSGKGSSSAGLTAAAVRDDFGDGQQWSLEAGALVLADQGVAAVDELDKMRSEDQSAMHEALEQQEISISKAGINATLKARCSLLGAANPTYGRFDEYEPVSEQIDLEPPLISRFDLIFTVTDKPDADRDRDLAEHIIKTNYAGELNTHRESVTTSNVSQSAVDAVSEEVIPEIEPDLLRKYIAYAKRHCYPTMSEEAKAAIQEFYVDMRSRGDGDGAIPVTARKLEALVRLAEASARIRLSDEVTTTDTERVIEIVRSSMEDVGMDPETGEFDADMIEAGTSKSQRDRIKNVKGIIRELQDEYDDGAPLEDVLERAEQGGIERTKAEHEIQKLKDRGDIYEPRSDHLRVV